MLCIAVILNPAKSSFGAFSNGHLEVCKWIFGVATEEIKAAMVLAVVSDDEDNDFPNALEDGHFDVCL